MCLATADRSKLPNDPQVQQTYLKARHVKIAVEWHRSIADMPCTIQQAARVLNLYLDVCLDLAAHLCFQFAHCRLFR